MLKYDLAYRESFTSHKTTFVQLRKRLDFLATRASKSMELRSLFRAMAQYLDEDERSFNEYDVNPLHEPIFISYESLGYRPFVIRDCDAKTIITKAQEIFRDVLPNLLADKYSNGSTRDYYETIATAMYHLFSKNSKAYNVNLNFNEEWNDGRSYDYYGKMATLSEFFEAFRDEYLKVDKKLEQRNARIERSNRYSDDSTFDTNPVESALGSLGLNRRDAHFVDCND